MPKSKNAEETIRAFADPVVEKLGYRLWDVAYERHGGYSEVTLYIDSPDGGAIGTDDCEKVSRAVDPLMDRYDPIEEAYTFSVSSSGGVRTLRRPEQYAAYRGRMVEIRLYRAENGAKSITGTLSAYDNGAVTIVTADGENRTFAAETVAQVKTVEEEKEDEQE
ncbi:MAG: ribosome maturation factor RimP [Clostridiaceae bacterium]|nr:ribosome maturation factor RimP [Clostridiaceae bacterium]